MLHQAQVYVSEVTDDQGTLIEPLLPVYTGRRPRSLSLGRVVPALLSLRVTGGRWAMVPTESPNHHSG